jgi:ubiquinone/menaquinone biosynthesis C-methylase UbiE
MNELHSKWRSAELAKTFLEGIRGAIPSASLQLEVLGKIVIEWCPTPYEILDLGCGDGILGRTMLASHSSAHVTFADFSEPMLEAAKKQIGNKRRATVVKADFTTPAWVKALAIGKHFDVILSGFAIHHQTDNRKRELYSEIYGLLLEGGIFLNLEHVSSATPSGSALFDSFFVDHLLRFHADASPHKTRREIEEDYYQRPDKEENILASVEMQCEWLRDIGFQDVDCFFKVFELALFGGRKSSNQCVHPIAEKAGSG